jgi:hypothetical protein
MLLLPAERCGASAALRACCSSSLPTCSTQTMAPDCQTHVTSTAVDTSNNWPPAKHPHPLS